MRTFIVFIFFFLALVLIATNMLGNVDLTPNSAEVAQAAAPVSPQPAVIALQESPTTTITTPNTIVVPTTGRCANPYTVVDGDWLLKIARNCDTTLAFILQNNPQFTWPNLIYPGDLVKLPDADAYAAPVPVTGFDPGIPSGTSLQVQATNFLPNTPVKVAIGPESVGYTVVANGVTNASGSLTTHIIIPNAPDSQTRWIVVVSTTTDPPVQAASPAFTIQ